MFILDLQLLTIAVLSIILTAPLGAIAIVLTGPRLLEKSTVKELEECDEDEEEEESEGYLEPPSTVDGGSQIGKRYIGDVEMQAGMQNKTTPEHKNLLNEGEETDRTV